VPEKSINCGETIPSIPHCISNVSTTKSISGQSALPLDIEPFASMKMILLLGSGRAIMIHMFVSLVDDLRICGGWSIRGGVVCPVK